MNLNILWDSTIVKEYPNLIIGYSVIHDVHVNKRDHDMEVFIKKKEEELRRRYSLEELKNVRKVRLYRDFFWRLGIDPTKKRPASEALLRRILRGKGLPKISNVVDAYNLASVETLITLSAYDLDKVRLPLSVRFARKGEKAILIGNREVELTGKEIVLTDGEGILCVLIHGDVERTKVTMNTKNIILIAYGVPGIDENEIINAIDKASEYIIRFAGGSIKSRSIVEPNVHLSVSNGGQHH